ncbi:MAG: 50S ribosomal protein L11 methyltransferase [Bacteroidales bacterium]|nr:50S ribosomal protein L11 methyltransferase [Bacteroidales bacterium]MDD3299882.1 50S ribosomal protein L11 methyltransferase [Bacteroidales bacterium]MDD3843214.1 50S ribosomal protein L11 methyltransferase [Bacteroidales bacterium]MDD4618069.1 50S ribosomal protein L11 methyltransferase [Bacteroidales bacterium]
MRYTEVRIGIDPFSEENAEVVVAMTQEFPFESYVYDKPFLKAYIPTGKFNLQELERVVAEMDSFPFDVTISSLPAEHKNWNEEWEKNFSPIVVSGRCTVKAGFHKELPETEFNIVIDPKMAFGTGHHQTTHLMIDQMLGMDLRGKKVLDMGCGTGILAILAAIKGAAAPVVAVDIDPDATDSARENSIVNHVGDVIEVITGDSSVVPGIEFDVILANINRNIILDQLVVYSKGLRPAGTLLLSGFYTEDIAMIVKKAEQFDLSFVKSEELGNWAVLTFEKS